MRNLHYLITAAAGCLTLPLLAQQAEPVVQRPVSMEIYGFTMMDAGYDFKQVHRDWYDVMRPTKLPAFKNQYGEDGETFFGVRQTRLGVKGFLPFPNGMELKTIFEFELFGTGVDAGQTTFRLRHAYGELGKFGAGQYWSPFMDIDVFPNSIEYWGPCGMAFFRNVQFRYMPIQGDTRLTFALERPGASADQGEYADRIELAGVQPQFQLPDLSGEFRFGDQSWGYVELAGIVRSIKWTDTHSDTAQFDLGGSATGWGLNLSSNVKFGEKNTLRLQLLYGEGVQNYMNDAPEDVGIQNQFSNTNKPIKGVALPVLGVVAFYDHFWNKKCSSSIGYSMTDIDNSDGQTADAFKKGQYALANVLFYPAPNVMAGVEYQWGSRENFKDNFESTGSKLQFSFKYNFSQTFYHEPATPAVE